MTNISNIFSIPYDDNVPLSLVEKKPAIEYSSRLANRFRLIAKLLSEGEYEEHKEDIISQLLSWVKG
ncbi:MAG: hypothetical protein HY368_02260 [Candidatus Aenigmarchaeota archaeon]|nr:hypothetical protein [Candidatus Aenigmarchaeota archaeon]